MTICAVTVTYADEMDLDIIVMCYEIIVLVVLFGKLIYAVNAHFGYYTDIWFFNFKGRNIITVITTYSAYNTALLWIVLL